MIKTLSLVGGMAGALACSQYPEFSQQYLQRLAGQVDALTTVAVDFDRSALDSGLGREEALQQMTGTPFLTDRQADMRATFARHARMSADLDRLRAATPMVRLTMPHRLADTETFAATWADFAPAVPTSTAGFVAGAVGFFGGSGLVGLLLAGFAQPLRRVAQWRKSRAQAGAIPVRHDPPVRRPMAVQTEGFRPTLMGETR